MRLLPVQRDGGNMGAQLFCAWKDTVLDNSSTIPNNNEPVDIKLPTFFRTEGDLKGFMAWDGFSLNDPDIHIAQLTLAYFKDIQEKASCGQCFPCRVGTRILLETLRRITDGLGKLDDLKTLRTVGMDIKASSKCTVGQTAPNPLLMSLDLLAGQWVDLIENPRKLPRLENTVSIVTAPCMDACPAHLDIPTYIEHIRNGRYAESLKLIRETNVLPGTCGRVCVRPCESNCRRTLVDSPLQIKYLKRFVADWEYDHHVDPGDNPTKLTKGPVAVIGAGPAGLACAYNLLIKGVAVTVFDALPRPGGMACVGIPDYRLPQDFLGYEIKRVEKMGATFRFGVRVGKDVTLPQLEKEGYKAFFLGVGAHESRMMKIPGEEDGYKGFIHGVHFLRAIALGEKTVTGKRMIVVGGGNVAIDCVRSALRIGFTDVNLVYRRSRQEMPADPVEIEDAIEEGINFHFLTTPSRLIADDSGTLTGVELIRMELGEPDKSGRRRPVPVENSEYILEADCVIPAIGQSVELSFVPEDMNLEMTRWHTILADEITGATSVPNVFSGGDCATGPATLIQAVGAGNQAAAAIDNYLQGRPVEPDDQTLITHLMHKMHVYDENEKVRIPAGYERQGFSSLPVVDRITHFGEVENVMTADACHKESLRCLRCYRMALLAL